MESEGRAKLFFKNKKIKKTKNVKRSFKVKMALVATMILALFSLPLQLNDTSTKPVELLSKQAKDLLNYESTVNKNNSSEVHADSVVPDSGIWTLYARLVMGDKDIEEDAKATGQIKLLGQGGVSADFPYTDIAKNGDDLTGDKSGTNLSAFLATYSYYGYIETVSGNAIASGTASFFGGIGRGIGSLIAGIALGISAIAEAINNVLAKIFMSLNPLALLGFGDSSIASNPLSDAITALLSNLGLNNAFFKAITALSMLLFTVFMAWQVIKSLSKSGVSKGILEPVKKWFIRILVLGVVLPMMYVFMAYVVDQVQKSKEDGDLTTSIVSGYIVNTRLWASTQNLAPASRLSSGVIPNANATSDMKFIDTDYEPSRQKKLIEKINSMSYASYGGSLQANAIGMALLKEWAGNDTFNVNTFAGDVNIAKNDIYMSNIPAVSPSANSGLTEPTTLAGYVWSADQNVTDENRLPTGKGEEVDFDANAKWGVDNNSTFSTQSVALLLQSELNSSGTKFYSYNLAPSGVQGAAKNMSTVKTEWRTASLVGHGILGKLGAWLAMVAESLVQGIYYLACAWTLFTISLIDILKRMFRRIFEVAVFASIPASAGLLAISLAVIVVAVMAMSLPSVLISLSRAFATTAVNMLPSSFLIDGLQNMITAIFSLGTCYFIAIPSKKREVTIIKTIMSLPIELAKQLDKRASLVLGSRNDAVRLADGIQQGMNSANGGSAGAKNPYYQGNNNMKDAVSLAFAGAGASSIAGKIANMGGQNDSSSSEGGNFKDQHLKSRDYVDQYKNAKPTDHLGRIVDENGNLVDADGNPIENGKYGMDGEGRLIDERGRLVDENGNLVDMDGNPIGKEQSAIVDSENRNFEKDAYGVNVDGNTVDEYGRLVDENGNLIDRSGNRLLSGEYGMDGEGRLIDEHGRLVDEEGNLVNEDGKILEDGELGYSVGGARVNDEGEITEEQSAKDVVESVTTTGYGEYELDTDVSEPVSRENSDRSRNPLKSNSTAESSVSREERYTGSNGTEFVNQEGQVSKSAKETVQAKKAPNKEKTDKSNEERSENRKNKENKSSSSTSPLMKKIASGTRKTAQSIDKAMAEAPSGSLARMTYSTKESVATGAKAVVKGSKILKNKKNKD